MNAPLRMDKKGFTLLELLMVVIIIAILASIALPQYFRVTERSRTAQALQLLASIRGAQLRYRATDPLNSYAATANLGLLDITIPAAVPGWSTLAVTGILTGGANVQFTRSAGTNINDTLGIDLDSGNICASDAPSATDWGVSPLAC